MHSIEYGSFRFHQCNVVTLYPERMLLSANSATLHLFSKLYLKKVLLLVGLFFLTRRSIGPFATEVSKGNAILNIDLAESLLLPIGPQGSLDPTDESLAAAPGPAYHSPVTHQGSLDAASSGYAEEDLYPSGSTQAQFHYVASEALPVSAPPARSTDGPAVAATPYYEKHKATFNPYWSFLLVMHGMLGVQYLALDLEDYIIVKSATSLPSVRFRTRANTWNKRRMRLCFYARQFVRRYLVTGVTLAGLLSTTGVALWFAIRENHVWSVSYRPLTYIVCLEALNSLVILLYPLQHIISIPTSQLKQSSIYLLNAEWLITQISQAANLLVGLLQFSIIMLCPTDYSPSGLSFHAPLCLPSILSRALDLHHLWLSTQISLAKMRFVCNTFSSPLRPTAKEEEWRCGICFEGEEHRNKRECLLRCTHVLHADCLFKWIMSDSQAKSAWCPVCWTTLLPPRSEELI